MISLLPVGRLASLKMIMVLQGLLILIDDRGTRIEWFELNYRE